MGKLLAIGFAATMWLLSNYFDLLLENMTRIMLVYENRRAYVACDLNELEGHSPVSGLFKCLHLCSAAIYKILTGTPASHGPSATAGLLVYALKILLAHGVCERAIGGLPFCNSGMVGLCWSLRSTKDLRIFML